MDRRYEPIKERREDYFIEYYPPTSGDKLAKLNIVFVNDINKNEVVIAMEKELNTWLLQYPIPLLVSSFDKKGDLLRLDPIKSVNHLIGFYDHNKKICMQWNLLKNEEIPNVATNQEYVNNIYSNLPFKTFAELDSETQKRRKQIKFGWFIFFIWLVPIPILIAVLENYNSWVSLIAMIYSIYKAIRKGLELTGKWPKSKRDKEKEKEEQLKNHYYYHCQINPEGFNKLKLENFKKMAMDDIAKEAKSLQIK